MNKENTQNISDRTCYNKHVNRQLKYQVSPDEDGMRTETFLKKKGLSSKLIIKLKKAPNGITLHDTLIYTTQKLSAGDVITLTLPLEQSSENIVATDLPFPIVYEDEDILVINKPANMPIHPSQGNYKNTLANAAAFYFQSKNQSFVYRAINRLDRDTTGLLILAKNPFSACFLSASMKNKQIKREYLAIVKGTIEEADTIYAPISRVDDSTIERMVDWIYGELAITHYKPLSYRNGLSLLSVTLDTGRTHQIRVHFAYINHPLLGDFLYYPDFSKINRQSLHSHKISFPHPITGSQMEFVCPLPSDMIAMLTPK
ncbi:MAG: RluA family pseudouridine synthase [Eubacteriales bacterium]